MGNFNHHRSNYCWRNGRCRLCKKPEQQATPKQETTTLNIGFQKYGILPIVKAKGELEKILLLRVSM
jgi:hypothetical protein